jgi:hypothetical protein
MSFVNLKAIQDAIKAGQRDRALWMKTMGTPTTQSAWTLVGGGGIPAAGTYPGAALTAAVQDNTTVGGINFPSVAPKTRHLTAIGVGGAASTPVFMIFDRLLVYPSVALNTNALQTMTNAVGLSRYVDGRGVMMMFESQVAASGTVTGTTVIYTNQDGNPATLVGGALFTANSPIGILNPAARFLVPLAGTDTGVRSITSIQLAGTTFASGTFAAVLVRPLAYISMPQAAAYYERDLVAQSAQLEQIFDGACLTVAVSVPNSGTYHMELETVYG